jgi:hypothetical protein
MISTSGDNLLIYGNAGGKGFIGKVAENGTFGFAVNYDAGGMESENIVGAVEALDGGFYLAGNTSISSFPTFISSPFVFKVNSLAIVEWGHQFEGSSGYFNAMIETPAGILTAGSRPSGLILTDNSIYLALSGRSGNVRCENDVEINLAQSVAGLSSSAYPFFTAAFGVVLQNQGNTNNANFAISDLCTMSPPTGLDGGANLPFAVKVYPNPSEGLFNLEWQSDRPQTVLQGNLTDHLGRQIRHWNTLRQNETLDLTGLSTGLYFLRLQTGDYSSTIRLVLQ